MPLSHPLRFSLTLSNCNGFCLSPSVFFSLFHCKSIYFSPSTTHWKRISLTSILFSSSNPCPRGVMVKTMDCGIVVSEFEFQSRYYVHFRTNTPPYPPGAKYYHCCSSRRMALAKNEGACGVMVIVVGNGHGDTSSNPGRD